MESDIAFSNMLQTVYDKFFHFTQRTENDIQLN